MRSLWLHPIPFNLREAIRLLAVILLLAASAQALPQSNHSWTETPWVNDAAAESDDKAPVLSPPLSFNMSGAEPSIYIGSRLLNFSDYAPSPSSCELWFQQGRQWSRYLQTYQGEDVDIILLMPDYGNVDLYLLSYASGERKHWSYKLLKGYHLLRLRVIEEGRHFLIASRGSEPGNSLILDALARPNATSLSPLDVREISTGRTMVTVRSEKMKGYDVYLNGVFYSSDIGDGSLDGIASFTLRGDKTHTISIFQRDIQGNIINKSEHTKRFNRDVAYTLQIQ